MLLVGPILAAVAVPTGAQPAFVPLATPTVLACAPRLAPAEATPTGLVVGAPDVPLRQMFGQGDAVVLSAGRAEGVSVGTQFFTQRVQALSSPELRARGARLLLTSGWVRAVEVDKHSALAVVEHTCADVRRGDQLAPFQRPAAVSIPPAGTADHGAPATVLFGRDGRSLSGAGQFLVIDQGADAQIALGQRLTFVRAAPGLQGPVTELGEAVAVLVDSTSATIQLVHTRSAVRSGDLAAVQR